MTILWQDIRFATRMLWKNIGLTLVAVLSLAIGIGANTAIFSMVNTIFLRPLPGIRDDGRLIDIYATWPDGSNYHTFSYPDFQYYRDNNKVFDGLTAVHYESLNMNADNRAERVLGVVAAGNFFDVLGVKPAHGRFFLPEEDKTPGTHPVAVISHGLWQRRFNSDPAMVGKTITLNRQTFTVIGIAPKGFGGLLVAIMPDVWIPIMMKSAIMPGEDWYKRDTDPWLHVHGHLREGVAIEQAKAEMTTLARQLEQSFPDTNRGEEVDVQTASSVPADMRTVIIVFISMLMVVVGAVLLIACANIAGMFLARAAARKKEISIRAALGASRGRIVLQLLTESVLLFLIGGVAGVLVAFWTTRLLLSFRPPGDVQIYLDLSLDWTVLIFTFLVSLATGIIFGLVPAMQASKTDVMTTLKDETSGGTARRSRGRSVFVVAQIAISFVLLVGAGLFMRSLYNARHIHPGFNPEGVYTISFLLPERDYDEKKGREFYRQIVERVEPLPGVRGVSLARMVPLAGGFSEVEITVEGHQPPAGEKAFKIDSNAVDRRYFEMLEVALLRGRNFNESDRLESTRVAIINETMARRFYPNADPIGQRFKMLTPDNKQGMDIEIIGIARNGKYRTFGEDPRSYVYFSFEQSYAPVMAMHVRAAESDAAGVLAALRHEVQTLDPDLPMLDVMPMRQQIGFVLIPLRLAATVVGILGLLGLLLAAIGIYGLISYSVVQRTREIGIRLALGAQRGNVLWLVVRQGMKLTIIGIIIGTVLSFIAARGLSSLLYGVSATDPLVFGGIALLLITVTLIASFIPARQATKVNPMIALRYE